MNMFERYTCLYNRASLRNGVLAGICLATMPLAYADYPVTNAAAVAAVAEDTQVTSRAELHARLADKAGGDNLIWSAASLDGLLALVGLGYSDENRALLTHYLGRSVEQAAQTGVGLNVKQDGLTVQSANNIWLQQGTELKTGYKADLADYFDGLQAGKMDVNKPSETANTINTWIADKTNQMIKNAVDPGMITPDLVSVLANALYFKGTWLEEFDPQQTKSLPFQGVTKQSGQVSNVAVPTMQKHNARIQFHRQQQENGGDVAILRLPYKGDTHAMYIAFAIKPEEDDTYGSIQLTEVDASQDVAAIYRQFIVSGEAFERRGSPAKFDMFTLPKFEIESELSNIQADLIAGGYEALFRPGALSRMSDDPRVMLSMILQKARIIVNEEGSEAAAVTIGFARAESIHMPKHLKVNGPFAYAIHDDAQGVTLFEGMVRKFEAGES